jgi:hypothetical protein
VHTTNSARPEPKNFSHLHDLPSLYKLDND